MFVWVCVHVTVDADEGQRHWTPLLELPAVVNHLM